MSDPTILILYTTNYRKGGSQFPVVARTLADEKLENGFKGEIVCEAVESKAEILSIIAKLASAGKEISEFHFVGHSGMYGPMFGTVAFPEQFSPYEWENIEIPFAARCGGLLPLLPVSPLVRSIFRTNFWRASSRIFLVHDILEKPRALSGRRQRRDRKTLYDRVHGTEVARPARLGS